MRKYFGHTEGHIVDLSWSEKSGDNWLLSAAIDKTVRLWHMTKDEAIATFDFDEIPKCVMFDPKDNCRFIVGFLGKFKKTKIICFFHLKLVKFNESCTIFFCL